MPTKKKEPVVEHKDQPDFMKGMDIDKTSPLNILKDDEIEKAEEEEKEEEEKGSEKEEEKKGEKEPKKESEKEEKEGEDVEDEEEEEEEEEVEEEEEEEEEPVEEKKPEKKKKKEDKEEKPKKEEKSTKKTSKISENVRKKMLNPKKITDVSKMTDLDKEIEYLKNNSLIKVKMPNTESYTQEDGKFNLQGYLEEYTNNLALSIQQNLLGGRLAATQFGILTEALKEEEDHVSSVSRRQTEAQGILDKLERAFPILKTDEAVQNRVERAILGEKYRRMNAVKAGEKVEEMKYEDFEKVIIETLPEAKKEKDTTITEKPKGSPSIRPTRKVKSEEDQDIDDMLNLKKKDSSGPSFLS